ncbi:MAG: zinc ABC transporter substrate-binding protein ZnuA [Aeromonas sp.]
MRKLAAYALTVALWAGSSAAHALEVLTSIKPIGLIAAAITDGVSEPQVLLPAGASPHDFALRPSDVRRVQQADLVVWIGEDLERFLAKPLALHPQVLTLLQEPTLPLRYYPQAESAAHHSEHGEAHAHTAHDGAHKEHAHASVDPHLWLGPQQAIAIAKIMSTRLSTLDTANAPRYQANLARFANQVQAQADALAPHMQAVQRSGYMVFHAAYGYWEDHFGMQAKDHFTLSPERRPGAKTLSEIAAKLAAHKAKCIFAEPQFSPAVIRAVARGTGARVLQLDEVGDSVPMGPTGYLAFMRQLGAGFAACHEGK